MDGLTRCLPARLLPSLLFHAFQAKSRLQVRVFRLEHNHLGHTSLLLAQPLEQEHSVTRE